MGASRSPLRRGLVAALLLPLVWPVSGGAQSGELPEWRVGERRKFVTRDSLTKLVTQEDVVEIVGVEETRIRVRVNGADASVTREFSRLEGVDFSSEGRRDMAFPLQLGKKWSYKEQWKNPSGSSGISDIEVAVAAFEKIETPAGRFDAFRIEAKGYWRNHRSGNSGRQVMTYWFAPEVRSVVRYEFNDGYNRTWRELVEVELPK